MNIGKSAYRFDLKMAIIFAMMMFFLVLVCWRFAVNHFDQGRTNNGTLTVSDRFLEVPDKHLNRER